jgi:hypothetical protein
MSDYEFRWYTPWKGVKRLQTRKRNKSGRLGGRPMPKADWKDVPDVVEEMPKELCPKCEGEGVIPPFERNLLEWPKCYKCNGTGKAGYDPIKELEKSPLAVKVREQMESGIKDE